MQIRHHKSFTKKYVKSSVRIQNKFKERQALLEKDINHPLLNRHRLHGKRKDQWSINVTGDMRAIYKWVSEDAVIFIDLDTHPNLYKM